MVLFADQPFVFLVCVFFFLKLLPLFVCGMCVGGWIWLLLFSCWLMKTVICLSTQILNIHGVHQQLRTKVKFEEPVSSNCNGKGDSAQYLKKKKKIEDLNLTFISIRFLDVHEACTGVLPVANDTVRCSSIP
jgi:hypothetical protein